MGLPEIVGVVVVLLVLAAVARGIAPKRQRGGVVIGPVRPISIFIPGVLMGLVKTGVVFAVYIGVTALVLGNPPAALVKWWELAMLFDMFMFCFVCLGCLPKDYKRYLDVKPKHRHTALDYFVGVVLSVFFVAGIGFHIVVLAQAPGWEF